jgi:hypothetical protein
VHRRLNLNSNKRQKKKNKEVMKLMSETQKVVHILANGDESYPINEFPLEEWIRFHFHFFLKSTTIN